MLIEKEICEAEKEEEEVDMGRHRRWRWRFRGEEEVEEHLPDPPHLLTQVMRSLRWTRLLRGATEMSKMQAVMRTVGCNNPLNYFPITFNSTSQPQQQQHLLLLLQEPSSPTHQQTSQTESITSVKV